MGATFEAITTDDQFLNTGYDMHVTNLHAGQIMRALGYGADLEANDGTPCGAKSLDEFHAKVRKALADWHRPDLHVYLDQLARLCQATAEIDDTARITWA
jgi:hypothetical protein